MVCGLAVKAGEGFLGTKLLVLCRPPAGAFIVILGMMLFTRSTYIGVYIPPAGKQLFYAAVDGKLKPMALGVGALNDILAFLGGQQQALAAINGPWQPNQSFMADEAYRQKLDPAPKPGRWEDLRVGEYLLGQRGYPVYQTPALQNKAKAWMRTGFKLHQRLEALGYRQFSSRGDHALFEAAPEISFYKWLGKTPLLATSLEGRIQRQLVLYDLGMDIPDPMRFFEEVTRYRILQGELPQAGLYPLGEIQALANAYMAWAASHSPEEISTVGDEQEGQITLPSKSLKK